MDGINWTASLPRCTHYRFKAGEFFLLVQTQELTYSVTQPRSHGIRNESCRIASIEGVHGIGF
jgi:hypothetical protein